MLTGAQRTRVGFVGGLGRSGSTLLELCLGGLPHVVAVGELVHVWERGLLQNQLCACGRPFHGCPFWEEVGGRAFGGWSNVDARRVLALKHTVDRTRYVPRLLSPRPGRQFVARVRRYAEHYHRIYAAALEVSGADVVIDSSKHVSLAACLRWEPELDQRLVHVTRDSRGVAYSWAKQVRRPEVADAVVYMPQYSATQVSLRWLTQNAMLEALAAAGTPRMHVRYEDFVAAPAATVRRVVSYLDLPEPPPSSASPGHVVLVPSHSVAGNPMRFSTGEVAVHADEAWRAGMPMARQRLVALLTLPLRGRYGYVGDG